MNLLQPNKYLFKCWRLEIGQFFARFSLARQRVEWSRSILDATRVSTSRRDGTHATRDPSSSKGWSEGDAQNNIKKN
ncbi:MAG: hypothetical protein IPQ04_05075 [Saprospiraceae bacterium]|nr:hypothetical protein [Saprospiraceae bacterium]